MGDRVKGISLAMVAVTLWSWPGMILRGQSIPLDPQSLVWLRFTLAWWAIAIILRLRSATIFKSLRSIPRQGLLGSLLAGFFLALNYLLFNHGVLATSASLGAILSQIGPLSLTLGGLFLLKERLSSQQKIGLGIFFVGLAAFLERQAAQSLEKPSTFGLGLLVVGALSWAASTLIQKNITSSFRETGLINLLMFLTPMVGLLPFVDWAAIAALTSFEAALVGFLAFSIVGSWLAYTKALQLLPASTSGILVASCPLVTLVSLEGVKTFAPHATFLPREPLSLAAFLAACLLAMGLALVLLPPLQSKERDALQKAPSNP